MSPLVLGTPAARRVIQQVTEDLENHERLERRGHAPLSHRCGRCSKPATYLDRALSGAICYVCYACNDKGHATFVQVGPFNNPLRRESDR